MIKLLLFLTIPLSNTTVFIINNCPGITSGSCDNEYDVICYPVYDYPTCSIDWTGKSKNKTPIDTGQTIQQDRKLNLCSLNYILCFCFYVLVNKIIVTVN